MSINHLYLIKRGPRPSYHKAPFHRVIICAKKPIAKKQAGATDDAAWVWERMKDGGVWTGFLLVRWNGFDIDYGHLVRNIKMPDGSHSAFFHEIKEEPFTLLTGAIWWDDKPMPSEIQKWGVLYPRDGFTQQSILDEIADDGCSGFGRNIPSHWKG